MLLAAFAFAGTAHAATLTWDADNGTAGVQDGDGNWDDDVTNNWTADSGVTNQNFVDANFDRAIFGSGAGGTVTMQSDVRTFGSGITFNDAYTIDTNGFQLGGQGGNITSNASGVNISGSGNYNLFSPTTITTSAGNDITFSAQVTGSHSLQKTGNGTMILSNDSNDFGDGTINTGLQINAGTVQLTSIADTGTASAAGDGGFVALGGAATLQFNAGAAGDSTDRELRLEGGASNNTINNQSGGTVTFTGDVVNGLTTGTLISTGNTNSITEIQGVLADNGANPLNITTTLSNELILSGDNTFTGDLTANNSAVITIGGAGQLGSGTYAGTIDLNQNANFFYASSADQTLVNGITSDGGTGNLVWHTGTGDLRLNGTNTYGGITRVQSGGGFYVNGDSSGATGQIIVNNGTLGGTGTIGGNVTAQTINVNATSSLSPGDGGIGTLTLGALVDVNVATATSASNNNMLWDLGANGVGDLLSVGGNFEFNSANNGLDLDDFTFTDLGYTSSTRGFHTWDLVSAGSLTGVLGSNLTDISGFEGIKSVELFISGNDIQLTMFVPEPSSTALLGLGLSSLLLRRRRS